MTSEQKETLFRLISEYGDYRADAQYYDCTDDVDAMEDAEAEAEDCLAVIEEILFHE